MTQHKPICSKAAKYINTILEATYFKEHKANLYMLNTVKYFTENSRRKGKKSRLNIWKWAVKSCILDSITTDQKIRSKWIYKVFNFHYLYSQCQEVIRLGRWSVVIPLSLLAFLFPAYLLTLK